MHTRIKYNHAIFLTFIISLLLSKIVQATPAKFDIPGDFPGDFQIDFLGTDFKLGGASAGSLSTTSTIQLSVGSETSTGSGIYNISAAPSGFNFLGFRPVGKDFDVYGAGIGSGTFDTNTGNWLLNMPTVFVLTYSGYATRVDLQLTTQNIWIPKHYTPGYWTTTASPMVLDETSVVPWGDLNLVAGGLVPFAQDLTLNYDWTLINAIAANYSSWKIDSNGFAGLQYEFNIYGNDPLISSVPVPAAVWLFGSGLIGLLGLGRKK